jgi:hypothetical protein
MILNFQLGLPEPSLEILDVNSRLPRKLGSLQFRVGDLHLKPEPFVKF